MVRETMKLMAGQKMQVIAYSDRVELVQKKKISVMRGFLKVKLSDAVIAATAILQQAVLLINDQYFSAIDGLSYRTLQLLPTQ